MRVQQACRAMETTSALRSRPLSCRTVARIGVAFYSLRAGGPTPQCACDRRDRPARRHRRCRPSSSLPHLVAPPIPRFQIYSPRFLRCPHSWPFVPDLFSGPVGPLITPPPVISIERQASCLGGGAVCAPSHPATQGLPSVARSTSGIVNTRAVGFPSLVLCTSASQPSHPLVCPPTRLQSP